MLVAILIKAAVIIPALIVIMVLTTTRRITFFQVELITAILIIPSVAWHWIIIQRFFIEGNNCKTAASVLWTMHLILVVESIWFYIKLWVITVFLFCSAALHLIKQYTERRARENQSRQAYDVLMREDKWTVSHTNIDPEEFWIICMESFDDNLKITQLPCNEKHIYHSKCIADWAITNPKCPLWNTDIEIQN